MQLCQEELQGKKNTQKQGALEQLDKDLTKKKEEFMVTYEENYKVSMRCFLKECCTLG